jgi:hypothetical protein
VICRFSDYRKKKWWCDRRAYSPSWWCPKHRKLRCEVCGDNARAYVWLHVGDEKKCFLSCCQDNCYRTARMRFKKSLKGKP